ncbi:AAA family ATPase [Pseudoalteromonas umbrosa]|uniref:AAA family ATPase n=1 Tax=Pseudoalteromonas umbrosa TaxID=3048489 RepID=UPI0024C26A3D|nr:AAA family ATPase [Pseudoalteromonas sp. B95]MDK1290118.1 AAA family ATPase [Pseudoalteromonas sp. B95]
MKLKSLFMEGFKTFAQAQTFDFTEYPEDGLCFVTGKNDVDPELGANGTGKSSLFDGLTLAFYGKTSRGLKAGDVASWQVAHALEDKARDLESQGKKRPNQKALTPSVTNRVIFENYNGDLCTINRRWNPNVLTLQINDSAPKNVDQKQLDALIGYTFDEFLQAAYFSQFQALFLDMSSTERAALVAKVLNLDVWDKYSDEAKKDADHVKDKLDTGRAAIERIKGQLDELEAQDFSEQIAQWEAEHTQTLTRLKKDLAEHQATYQAIQDAIEADKRTLQTHQEALTHHQANFESQLNKQSQPLYEERDRVQEALEAQLDKASTELTALEDTEFTPPQQAQLKDLEYQANTITSSIAKHEQALESIDKQIIKLEQREQKVQRLEGDCSTCGQPITPAQVNHELAICEAQIVELEAQIDTVETALRKDNRALRANKKARAELSDAVKQAHDAHRQTLRLSRDKLKGARRDLQESERDFASRIKHIETQARKACQTQLNELSRQVSNSEAALANAQADAKAWSRIEHDLMQHIAHSEAQTNPYQSQQESRQARLDNLTQTRQAAFEELEEIVMQEQASRFWVKGFKSVKLFAVSAALNELEAEVNSALDGLGLGGWSVEFDVDKETKKGTLSKGFFAFINSADNLEPVKWEAWSGGESQRLRLAASLGLANMIRASKGLELPFEIWDEPSQWMSDSGITGLLDVLQRRARRLKRQIWLIDHRGLEHPFDAAIEITKTYNGSTIKNVSQSFTGVSTRY